MRKGGKTRKKQKADRKAVYGELERNVSGEAARNFHKQTYAVGAPGIRVETAVEYLDRKCNIKKKIGTDG